MSPRWTNVLAAALVAVSAVGCASTQPKLKRDLEVMRRETTPAQLVARGEAFAAVGDMTRAEQYFVAALRSGGEAGKLARRLVAVCVADGRYPAALEYADEYLRKHPVDPDLRFAAAVLRRALGDADGAYRDLKHILLAQPNFADAHYVLAQIERDRGNLKLANAEFREYLKSDPAGTYAEEVRGNLVGGKP